MTWLIVEDDPEIRNLVAVMMQVWGETPLPLADGNAAWRWLDSVADGSFKGQLPELALMDIRMPGHTGDQIAARIRTTELLQHIPIILMTAFTLTESEIQSMVDRAGIDRVIKKPLPDMDDFRATLYRVRDEKQRDPAAKPAEKPAPVPPLPVTAQPSRPTPVLPTPSAPATPNRASQTDSPNRPPAVPTTPADPSKPTSTPAAPSSTGSGPAKS